MYNQIGGGDAPRAGVVAEETDTVSLVLSPPNNAEKNEAILPGGDLGRVGAGAAAAAAAAEGGATAARGGRESMALP